MAYGDITKSFIHTLGLAAESSAVSSAMDVAGNIHAVAYRALSHPYTLHLVTFDNDSEGNFGEVKDTVQVDEPGNDPFLFRLSASKIGVAYRGPDQHGWIKTYDIDGNGNIAALWSNEFDSVKCWYPFVLHRSGNVFIILYKGMANSNGQLITQVIFPDGTFGAILDTFDIGKFISDPQMRLVNGDIYLMCYGRQEVSDYQLYAETISIDATGFFLSGIIHSVNLDTTETDMDYHSLVELATNYFGVAYDRYGDSGRLVTFSVNDSGFISAAISSFLVDAEQAEQCKLIKMGNQAYLLAYAGTDGHGFVQSISIADDGTGVSQMDIWEFNPSSAVMGISFIHRFDGIYMISYTPSTIVAATFAVETTPPAANPRSRIMMA